MKKIILSNKNLAQISTLQSLKQGATIYHIKNELYKLYCLQDSKGKIYRDIYRQVDIAQLSFYDKVRDGIKKTTLPKGIIYYRKHPIGVLYDFFDGYQSFNSLYLEEKEIIFNNLKKAIDAMNELIEYEIYNSDLCAQNILYKGKEVEFIDLDGPYVGYNERYLKNMYENFMNCIFNILNSKIMTQYSIDDYKKIKKELERITNIKSTIITGIDTVLIDKVEKTGIIK